PLREPGDRAAAGLDLERDDRASRPDRRLQSPRLDDPQGVSRPRAGERRSGRPARPGHRASRISGRPRRGGEDRARLEPAGHLVHRPLHPRRARIRVPQSVQTAPAEGVHRPRGHPAAAAGADGGDRAVGLVGSGHRPLGVRPGGVPWCRAGALACRTHMNTPTIRTGEAPVLHNFIGGRFVPPRSANYIDDINPATEEIIAAIPDSDSQDIDDAVAAARSAFPSWSRTPAAERSRLLLKLADLIEQNLEELARLESQDNGKTISLARRLDIPRAVLNFRFFATGILHQSSEAHPT